MYALKLISTAATFALINSAALASGTGTAPPHEPELSHHSYMIMNQPIDIFLRELARDSGERIQHSDSARGQIVKRSFSGTVPEILNKIAASYDLDWFAYNSVFFVSSKREATTRMIRLGDLSLNDALAALKENKLMYARYPVTSAAENTALSITGPPKLVAIIESVIEGIPSNTVKPRKTAKKTIKIRRGTEIEIVPVK